MKKFDELTGLYSLSKTLRFELKPVGKTLEQITHGESPWMDARKNGLPGEPSNEVISKEAIKEYFSEVARNYEIDSVDGIKKYISSRLQIV